VGIFVPDLNPLAWFDELLIPDAWFDPDLIPLPDLRPLLAAFVAIRPDYPHPEHDHDDLVATTTADFLALSVVVVAALKRLQARRAP
jgi:hypothetical protein